MKGHSQAMRFLLATVLLVATLARPGHDHGDRGKKTPPKFKGRGFGAMVGRKRGEDDEQCEMRGKAVDKFVSDTFGDQECCEDVVGNEVGEVKANLKKGGKEGKAGGKKGSDMSKDVCTLLKNKGKKKEGNGKNLRRRLELTG